ncbi:MAG: alcohol dehydrogenase [Candidatus Epulonipiscioides saccharophilum]|nr:MAG: alcohol dehydrogenase [Epulopiscium sp. AS2M-Bin001]
MKEIMMQNAFDVAILENEMPVAKEGEALLKILYGGICGSDLSSYRGTMKYINYPTVPGHEFSAEIVEIGDNDKGLKSGDLVTAIPYFNCGHCYSCQKGLVNCCSTNQTMGIHRTGAFAEYITLPVERLFAGNGLSAKTLALVEPFCISYHGIKKANIQKGDKVLIVGAGTIGVLAAIAALENEIELTICDISQSKVDYAKKFGVQNTICNSSPEVFAAEVNRLTDGNGYDIVVEAVGLPSTFQNCMDAVAFGGKMIQLGVGKQNVDLFFTTIQQKELSIYGSRNARREDFKEAIELLSSGKIKVDDVVTNMYNFEDAPKAFADFHSNAGSMLKVMIEF